MNDSHRDRRHAGIQSDAPSPIIAEPLRSVLANSQVVLFTQDLELRYTWIFNPHLEFRDEDVLGKCDEELLPTDEAACLHAIKRRVLDTGQAARETVRVTRAGAAAYYDLFVEPLRDADGTIIGVTCAATDTTAHQKEADEFRFQSIVLETISAAVIAVDLSQRIIYWNRGAEGLFGYSSDEMLGEQSERLFPEEERGLFPERFATVMDGKSHHGQWKAVDKHGAVRWIDMTARAIRDAEGTITGVVGVGTDVTESKRIEEQQRFQTLVLESIHDSVIVTDLEGRITYWNRGAEDAFGYDAEQMLGQSLARIYPGANPDEVAADLDFIAAGNDFHGEWCGRRRDGEPVWVDIRTTALRDDTGACVGFVGMAKDITLRKEIERQRDRLLAQERASRRRLRQFLALVAHDLRGPLTIMSGYIQLLRRGTLALHSAGYAQAIEASAEAAAFMQRLVEDLGDAAAVGEGQFAIQPASMDLSALVEEVAAERQASSEHHRVLVRAPEAVHGVWDEQRLRQLLTNLIDNAIKYSPLGGEVAVTVDDTGTEVVVSVRDSGIGMEPEEMEHLFDVFVRGKEAEEIAGFGLGLYICRAIVDAHGGGIEVESAPGEGSVFRVVLPRRQPDAPSTGTVRASSGTA